MMCNRMLRMTGKIQRRMRRRIGPLARLLRALDVALVDRRIEYALALLGAVLLMHRPSNLLALGCQWHDRCLSICRLTKCAATGLERNTHVQQVRQSWP